MFRAPFKTSSYFCWLSFLHSVWVRKPKKYQQQVFDHFDGSEDFFNELFFWISVWWASKEQFNSFETKSNLKGSPITSKATTGYFGQNVWNWLKRNVPFPFLYQKSRPDRNSKGFTYFTCERGEKFASYLRKPQAIVTCGVFCLPISLPAAFGGNFARASFTEYSLICSSTPSGVRMRVSDSDSVLSLWGFRSSIVSEFVF